MTPDDLCENVRNTVFEILRRRYPETMPTKCEWKTAVGVNRPGVAIRDKENIVFYVEGKGKDVAILCNTIPFSKESINDVREKYVFRKGKLDLKMLHLCIDYAINDILVEVFNPIADEFGLGVER